MINLVMIFGHHHQTGIEQNRSLAARGCRSGFPYHNQWHKVTATYLGSLYHPVKYVFLGFITAQMFLIFRSTDTIYCFNVILIHDREFMDNL